MVDRNAIQFILQGIDQTAKATRSSASNLNKLAKQANSLQAIALVALAKRTVQATAELVVLGAGSLAARDRLVAFAGGAEQADKMLASFAEGTNNTVDQMNAAVTVSRLLETEVAQTGKQMRIAAGAATYLGDQTWSVERRMTSLTMLLTTGSKLRFDDFGLSVESVTARQKELEVQLGLTTDKARQMAIYEALGDKLGILGDQSDTAATKVGQLAANWSTLNQVMGESAAIQAEQSGAMEWLTGLIGDVSVAVEANTERVRMNKIVWLARWEAIRSGTDIEGILQAGIEARTEALREQADVLPDISASTIIYMDTLQKNAAWQRALMQQTNIEIAGHTTIKDAEASAIESANQRMAQSTANYASQAASVYASLAALETSHAARMEAIAARGTGGGRKSLMGQIAKAQSRAMKALQDKLSQRDFDRSLETMAEDHEKRLAEIRGEGGDDTVDAEKKHAELIARLYTQEARDAEEARFHNAQKVSSDAEQEEIQRYNDARDAAIARREQRKADEAERLAITKRFDKQRQEEQAAMEGAAAGQAAAAQQAALDAEVANYEARKLELETSLATSGTQYAEIEKEHGKMLDRIIRDIKSRLAKELREAQPGGDPLGPGYQWPTVDIPGNAAGTGSWKGGPTWVGEREPELLNVPPRTSITPMSKMGGVTIINHFGRDSIRSDRDIVLLEKRQRQSLRLRGRAN